MIIKFFLFIGFLLCCECRVDCFANPLKENYEVALESSNFDRLEATLVMVKPEAFLRGCASSIIADLDKYSKDNELVIIEIKEIKLTKALLEEHYYGKGTEHIIKAGNKLIVNMKKEGVFEKFSHYSPYELGLMAYNIHISNYIGQTALCIVLVGPNAVEKIFKIKGATNPADALPNTLRSKYAAKMSLYQVLVENRPLDNAIHAPENIEEAERDMYVLMESSIKKFISKYNTESSDGC